MIKNRISRAKIPFNPAKTKIFYGWAILFLGAFGILMSIPGQTMGVSVFTNHLLEALKLSREELSMAYLVGTISSALTLPMAGWFSDKYGIRITAVLSGLIMGLVLIYMTQVDRIGEMISLFLFNKESSVINFITVAIGFFGLRFSGQGVMTMVSRNMVMKWFKKNRGIANAIMGLFTTFGFSIAPLFLAWIKGLSSWRGAWGVLALTSITIFVPIALIFYRDNPQECGLQPDGKGSFDKKSLRYRFLKLFTRKNQNQSSIKSFTLSQAMKTSHFWIFNLSIAFWALFNTAFTFHLISIFESSGRDEKTAVMILFPIAIIATIIRAIGSSFSLKIGLKNMLYIMFAAMGITAIALINFSTLFSLILVIIGLGIAQGLFGVLNSLTWIHFFGPKHLGTITGITMASLVAGSAVGPAIFSYANKIEGNYAFAGVISLFLIGILTIWALLHEVHTRKILWKRKKPN